MRSTARAFALPPPSSWLNSVWGWETCSIFNPKKNKTESWLWCVIIITLQDTAWVATALFCSKSMWIVQDKPLSWVGTWKEMFNRLLNIYIYYSHITPCHLYIALNDVIQVIHLEFSWFLQYWLPHLHKMNRINCYKSKNIRLPGYILLDANENGFVPTSLK